MTPEQQEAKRRAEVMLAFADGAPIEFRQHEVDRWAGCDNPLWNWIQTDYRVSETPIVNWDAMPAWANWVAMSIDFEWYWFDLKPENRGVMWHSASMGGLIPAEHAPKYAGTKPWYELIIERPKK